MSDSITEMASLDYQIYNYTIFLDGFKSSMYYSILLSENEPALLVIVIKTKIRKIGLPWIAETFP